MEAHQFATNQGGTQTLDLCFACQGIWFDRHENLKLESRVDPALVDQLRAAGHDVQVVGAFEDMMGHAGAVAFHPDGRIEGATDPRADGVCAGV